MKILLLLLTLSVFMYANEGPVGARAVVSTKNILSGNIVELHIRATGKHAVFPIVEKIDGIKVLSQDERITNMHVYNNGVLQRECTIFTLTFAPQKDMTIPSFEVEIDGRRYKTKPIKLRMKDLTTSNRNKSNIFSLKLKANKRSVTVGEAFLATVTLSLQHDFVISKKLQYFRPKFEGFFVEQMDKGKSWDEGNYQVTELKYILTPHTEGNYTLGPAYAKVGLRDETKKGSGKIDRSRKIFQKASNTLQLEVLPQTGTSDLVGRFTLESKIDARKVAAGKPVTLRIELEGEGDLTHFEFPDYAIDGVTIYNNPEKLDISVKDGKIFSSYSREFVFISDEDFTIPEQRFSLLDPATGEVKELKVEAIDIETGSSTTGKQASKASRVGKAEAESEGVPLKERAKQLFRTWGVSILAFLLGGLFLYLLRYLSKYKPRTYTEPEALKILIPHIAKDPEVDEMVRRLYARINGDSAVKIDRKRLKALIEKFR